MDKRLFDPNAAASSESGIFGLPYTEKEAKLIYLPVPWEATTSYGAGTSNGPSAILSASKQVDLFDRQLGHPYEPGLFLRDESEEVLKWNEQARLDAEIVIEAGGVKEGQLRLTEAANRVNEMGHRLNEYVYRETKNIIDSGKLVALIGGDHSVPFGALKAVAEREAEFGVLHIDAHSDTRRAFEGFVWSHASIMFNVLEEIPQVKKLVQLGIRDFCEEESVYCRRQGDRVSVFYDEMLLKKSFEGLSWSTIAKEVVQELPEKVWISFDIDGLEQRYCPNTGTPVPGGLDFNQAVFLIEAVAKSKKKIIGFDLCEVAVPQRPEQSGRDEWDANVGARMLYKMSAWTLFSHGFLG